MVDEALRDALEGHLLDDVPNALLASIGYFVFSLSALKGDAGSSQGFAEGSLSMAAAWHMLEQFQDDLTSCRADIGCPPYHSPSDLKPFITQAVKHSKSDVSGLCLLCERQRVSFHGWRCSHAKAA